LALDIVYSSSAL